MTIVVSLAAAVSFGFGASLPAAVADPPRFVTQKAMFWLDANDAGEVGREVPVWRDHRGAGYLRARSYREILPQVIAVKEGPLAGKKAVTFFSFGTHCDMDFTRQRVKEAFFVMEMDRPEDDANFYLGDARQCLLHGGYKTGAFFFEAGGGMVGRCTIALDGKRIERPLETMMPDGGYHLYSWTAGSNKADIYVGRITQDRSLEKSYGHKRTGGKRLCEMVLFNRALTDAERAQIENYLTVKWFGSKGGAN